jgi:hypothetical protein
MEYAGFTESGGVFLDEYGYSEYINDESSPVKKYRLDSYYLRFGLIYNLTADMGIGFDAIITAGKYSEDFHAADIIDGNNESYQLYKNGVTFRHYNAGFSVHHRFSDYVALKGIFNYYYNTYDYNFFNSSDDKKLKKYEYGGAFELIF